MEQVLYTKFSNERAPEFAIHTSVVQEESGSRVLYKKADYPAGEAHIRHIEKAAQTLEISWKDTEIRINRCTVSGKGLKLEELKGATLEEELDLLLEKGEVEAAGKRMLEVLRKIRETADGKFHMTSEFEKVFGNQIALEGAETSNPADIDLIFSNIMLGEDGNIHVIDYEWVFFFPVPIGFVLYRALHYYLESASKRKKLKDAREWYLEAGITREQQDAYSRMEQQFQRYIQGDYVPNGELYQTMGKAAVPLEEMQGDTHRRRMQVYLNDGTGFCEEHSYFVEQGYKEQITEHIRIPEGTKELWIDPVLCDCILQQVQIIWGNGAKAEYETNGCGMEPGSFLFAHSDPKLMISKIPQGEYELTVSYGISILEHSTAQMLVDKVNTAGRIKKKIRGIIKE